MPIGNGNPPTKSGPTVGDMYINQKFVIRHLGNDNPLKIFTKVDTNGIIEKYNDASTVICLNTATLYVINNSVLVNRIVEP